MRIQLSDHFSYTKLLRYALPSIIMTVFISLYGIMDGLFVSNFAGKTPFAAISLILPFVFAMGSVGFMIGTGGAAIIAKTLGKKQQEKANRIFSMLIAFTAVAGMLLTIVGLLIIRPVATTMGATGDLLENSVLYGSIMLSFQAFFMLQSVFQSLFRKSLILVGIGSVLLTAVGIIFAAPIAQFFVGYDLVLLKMSQRAFALYALSFLICGFNIFSSAFFTALNNGAISAAISFARTLFFQALAIIVLPLFLGLDGIWLAVVAAETMALALAIFFFIRKKKQYHYA